MSRIGRLPINIPQGVKVNIEDSTVNIEGPKGKLSQIIRSEVNVHLEDDKLIVERTSETKVAKSMHGMFRSLFNNMVTGVSQGFTKVLLINGVGYRAEVNGNALILNLGFSNPIEYPIPEGMSVTCESQTKIVISGINKEQVGQVASEIRSIRPPEPYKGKGVRYEDEYVRRKVGKAGIK